MDDHQHHLHAEMDHPMSASDKMDHSMDTGMNMGHMMMMYFHAGVNETILFSFWKISTVGGLIGSAVGIFLLAMLYEGLKVCREYLQTREIDRIAPVRRAEAPNNDAVFPTSVAVVIPRRRTPFSVGHVVQTLLHAVQLTVSYFLMLIFMTYNVWLCIAVVLGAAAGFFAFGWTRRITTMESNEHCH